MSADHKAPAVHGFNRTSLGRGAFSVGPCTWMTLGRPAAVISTLGEGRIQWRSSSR
ncbi:MAG: hypothetical protein WC969_00250 [Elusimicrobiota bacterium]